MLIPPDFIFSSNLGQLLLIVIFILFVFAVKRIVKIIFTAVIIGIASLIFPFAMNYFFSAGIPITIETILYFTKLGLGLYGIYLLARIIYIGLGVAEKFLFALYMPIRYRKEKKKKELEKKVEDFIKEREEEKKKKEKISKKLKEHKNKE